jgi:hypothetical protein
MGRRGDIATISAAFRAGVPRALEVCNGAARGGRLVELEWLLVHQRCSADSNLSSRAAASGSVPVLDFLKQCGMSFTLHTACSAAAAGHQHVIEYLHAEACPINKSAYLAAAVNSHVHVLQRLREQECAWDSEQLCSLAALKGLLPVLQWAEQQNAVFTEDTMMQAAAGGHTAVCAYLHAQQCPRDPSACTIRALYCHLGTLQWLLEHGYPCIERLLWRAAAMRGHISVLEFLLQTGVNASPRDISMALFKAGSSNHLAAAQWLRAQGAEWPPGLSMEVNGAQQQWEGAVLEWARAEGCTSPLQ